MDPKALRNLHPHKSARVAILLYHDEYAAQRGGSMDFWDELTEARVAELEAGRSDLIATIEAMNEENAQLAHRLWCLENPE